MKSLKEDMVSLTDELIRLREKKTIKERVRQCAEPVREWIKESDGRIWGRVQGEYEKNGPAPTTFFAFIFVFGGSIVGLALTIAILGENQARPFPATVWLFVCLIPISALLSWLGFVRDDKKSDRFRNAAQGVFERERDADPFYQRAKLIMEAVDNFTAHCDRYQAWQELVERNLEEPNEEAADRYFAMLERSASVILRAIENFAGATDRAKQLEEFVQAHPAIKREPESTALNQLVELLDRPVEMPTLPIKDPCEALAFEETLQELSRELSQPNGDLAEFERRIAASQATRRQRVDGGTAVATNCEQSDADTTASADAPRQAPA